MEPKYKIITSDDPGIFQTTFIPQMVRTIKRIDDVKKSILANGWDKDSYIVSNNTMRIFDGHHRTEALKQIKAEGGDPVTFNVIICEDEPSLNTILSRNKVACAGIDAKLLMPPLLK